jgi:hypothetical protein
MTWVIVGLGLGERDQIRGHGEVIEEATRQLRERAAIGVARPRGVVGLDDVVEAGREVRARRRDGGGLERDRILDARRLKTQQARREAADRRAAVAIREPLREAPAPV